MDGVALFVPRHQRINSDPMKINKDDSPTITTYECLETKIKRLFNARKWALAASIPVILMLMADVSFSPNAF